MGSRLSRARSYLHQDEAVCEQRVMQPAAMQTVEMVGEGPGGLRRLHQGVPILKINHMICCNDCALILVVGMDADSYHYVILDCVHP